MEWRPFQRSEAGVPALLGCVAPLPVDHRLAPAELRVEAVGGGLVELAQGGGERVGGHADEPGQVSGRLGGEPVRRLEWARPEAGVAVLLEERLVRDQPGGWAFAGPVRR